MRIKTHLAMAALAAGLLTTGSGLANAQMSEETWTHTSTPNARGQCWVMTDKLRGIGYWGKCPESQASATTTIRRSARHSRIETTGQAPKGERY